MGYLRLLKYKITLLLVRWIASDTINKLEANQAALEISIIETKNHFNRVKYELSQVKGVVSLFEHKHYKLQADIKNVINVGLDISARPNSSSHDHSWMVVCLKDYRGEDFVKFFNLDNYNPKQVMEMVNSCFGTSNKVEDYPRGMPHFGFGKKDKLGNNSYNYF